MKRLALYGLIFAPAMIAVCAVLDIEPWRATILVVVCDFAHAADSIAYPKESA